jgi:hypothetical protein
MTPAKPVPNSATFATRPPLNQFARSGRGRQVSQMPAPRVAATGKTNNAISHVMFSP